ncbi:uncharacterized protein VTP21DRAFT_148 [Calcarisporiella thermophila]|uniref:uncharacterized protein n=1 Tax=Calcarisporiella thermophila TaxID=911321 RepID=UPI003743581C
MSYPIAKAPIPSNAVHREKSATRLAPLPFQPKASLNQVSKEGLHKEIWWKEYDARNEVGTQLGFLLSLYLNRSAGTPYAPSKDPGEAVTSCQLLDFLAGEKEYLDHLTMLLEKTSNKTLMKHYPELALLVGALEILLQTTTQLYKDISLISQAQPLDFQQLCSTTSSTVRQLESPYKTYAKHFVRGMDILAEDAPEIQEMLKTLSQAKYREVTLDSLFHLPVDRLAHYSHFYKWLAQSAIGAEASKLTTAIWQLRQLQQWVEGACLSSPVCRRRSPDPTWSVNRADKTFSGAPKGVALPASPNLKKAVSSKVEDYLPITGSSPPLAGKETPATPPSTPPLLMPSQETASDGFPGLHRRISASSLSTVSSIATVCDTLLRTPPCDASRRVHAGFGAWETLTSDCFVEIRLTTTARLLFTIFASGRMVLNAWILPSTEIRREGPTDLVILCEMGAEKREEWWLQFDERGDADLLEKEVQKARAEGITLGIEGREEGFVSRSASLTHNLTATGSGAAEMRHLLRLPCKIYLQWEHARWMNLGTGCLKLAERASGASPPALLVHLVLDRRATSVLHEEMGPEQWQPLGGKRIGIKVVGKTGLSTVYMVKFKREEEAQQLLALVRSSSP